MHTAEKDLPNLPEDSASLKAMLCSLLAERDREKQRADDLHIQNLRLQLELARYKKWYYGPRADRLNSTSELAQVLLDFGQELSAADSSGRCPRCERAGIRIAASEAA